MKRAWIACVILLIGITATNAFGQSLPPISASIAVAPSVTAAELAGTGAAKEDKLWPLQEFFLPDAAPRTKVYGSTEYLFWWMKKLSLPALITQGSINDIPTGALGQPGTTVLRGNERISANPLNGGRFTAGIWLGCDRAWAIEGSYFFLAARHASYSITHNGNPAGTTTLNVPFFNADGNFEDAVQIGIPGVQSGTIGISTFQRLMGYELNLRRNLIENDCYRLSFSAGFRCLSLQEGLDLSARFDALPLPINVNSSITDRLGTQNRFHGGQIGFLSETLRDRWLLSAQGKIALGTVNQHVTINGSTTTNDPINGTVVTPGGLFTAPSNMGDFNRNLFAVVPEIGLNIGYQVTRNVSATVGYNFLYCSNVVRPGDQIDRGINFAPPANAPTRPAFNFNASDYWAQGINFGLMFRF